LGFLWIFHPSLRHFQWKDLLPELASWMCEIIGAVDGIDESDLLDTSCIPITTGEHIDVEGHHQRLFYSSLYYPLPTLLLNGIHPILPQLRCTIICCLIEHAQFAHNLKRCRNGGFERFRGWISRKATLSGSLPVLEHCTAWS